MIRRERMPEAAFVFDEGKAPVAAAASAAPMAGAPDVIGERIAAITRELRALDALGHLPEGFDLGIAMADGRFAELTAQLPPLAAARVYDAERRAADAERIAMQNLAARMMAREALPMPARAGAGFSPERDYASMSPESFRRMEEEMRMRARRGERVML